MRKLGNYRCSNLGSYPKKSRRTHLRTQKASENPRLSLRANPFYSAKTAGSVADIGKQRELTRTLDSNGKLSLMSGACACDSAGQNLCSFGDEATKLLSVLIINELRLLYTESADFSAALSVHGATALGIFLFKSHDDILLIELKKRFQNGKSSSSTTDEKSSAVEFEYAEGAALAAEPVPLSAFEPQNSALSATIS